MAGAERAGGAAAGSFVGTSGADRRVGWSFLRKWEDLCVERGFPTREEFKSDTMGALWPHIFIIDVRAGLEKSNFEYCGPVLVAACGSGPLTGKALSGSLPKALWETMPYAFQAVINTKKAIISSHHAALPGSADFPYRCVVAPVGDSDVVEYLVGAFSYRELI